VSAVHRGVVRLVKGTTYADFNEREVFLQLAPTSFDASTLEIWGALLNGARLVIMANGATSLRGIGETLRRHGVTTLWLTAGLFHLMVDEELDSLRGLRQLLSGGDVLSVPHVRRALSELKGCRLINGYGPTENTTFTCCYPMTDPEQVGASVPIGRPISNTQVYLLDAHMQPVPIGVPGELYTGGDGLARGYFNRPELTAERFVRSPFGGPGERLYKTGDLARYRADGAIEFLGRIDAQVKIRGYRVEPGEIESALMQHPGVRDAVVVARGDTVAGKRLVAYVVPARGQEPPEPRALKEHLKARLPDPMIPSAYVLLEGLPLNANGKPDRRALPDPEAAEGGGAEEQTAPRDEMELWIASVWREVLGAESVGAHDNFFDAGGNSLLMARVHTKLNNAGGEEVSMVDLFTYPTVSALARYLKNKRSGSPQRDRLARVKSNDHGAARARRARAGRQNNG
jgi:aspartate racemase